MFLQSQCVFVSAAHRYWNNLWSHEHNKEVYGHQASPVGVGSNFKLEVALWSQTAEDFAFTEPLNFLKQLCDHKCFYSDVPEFESRPSTLELITQFLAPQLFKIALPQGQWAYLKVWENDRLACRLWRERSELEVEVHHANLQLTFTGKPDMESGLVLNRKDVPAIIQKLFINEGRLSVSESRLGQNELFTFLKGGLPALTQLQINASSHYFMLMKSKPYNATLGTTGRS